MRNVIPVTIGLVIVVSLLYFLPNSSQTPQEISSPPLRHVSLYHYFSGSLSGGVDETVSVVNSYQDNGKIIPHPLDHEAFKSLIISNLSKGDPPELFTYWAGVKTQQLIDSGYLESLDDIWEKYSLDAKLSETLVQSASVYNTHKYLLPLDQHVVVFFYNTSIFKELNIDLPATLSDLDNTARTILQRGITPFALGALERWPAQFWFDYLLLRTAGPIYRQALMQGKKSYLDPEVVRVYQLWSDMISRNYFNGDANSIDWAAASRKVCTGEAAMTLMGTWAIQQFVEDPCNMQEETDFDFFPFPIVDQGIPSVSVGPVDGLVITRNSVNNETAKHLLHFFLDQKAQQAFSNGSGAFAASNAVPIDFYSPLKQRIYSIIEQSDHWAFNYDLATPPAIADFGMDSFTELIAFPEQYKEILSNLVKHINQTDHRDR